MLENERSSVESVNPLSILKEMEETAINSCVHLPIEQKVEESWIGIGFTVNGCKVISPVGEIHEVISLPTIALIPGTKQWVHGLANIRGALIPVIGLNEYLTDSPVSRPLRTSRVAIVNLEEFSSGLMVNEVTGMQHYSFEGLDHSIEGCPDSISEYVFGSVEHEGEKHFVFSVKKLTDDVNFSDVSI